MPTNAGTPARIQVTDSLRRWWLARYSLDEIRELADALESYLDAA